MTVFRTRIFVTGGNWNCEKRHPFSGPMWLGSGEKNSLGGGHFQEEVSVLGVLQKVNKRLSLLLKENTCAEYKEASCSRVVYVWKIRTVANCDCMEQSLSCQEISSFYGN
jgi:hypothetical protein